MKLFSILMAMVVCACAPTAQQVTLEPPTVINSAIHDGPRYSDKEVMCAQAMITKLYDNAEKYGNEFFIFTIPPSELWNWYLGCIHSKKNIK